MITPPPNIHSKLGEIIMGKNKGYMWNQHLVCKLKEARFTQRTHEECLFYQAKTVYILYTDDSILMGPN